MKLVFAGTPDFAVPALEALVQSNHDVIAVLTQPDRPAGRGKNMSVSAVKSCAVKNNIRVHQPEHLRGEYEERVISLLEGGVDALIVVAYGLLIPESILNVTRYGCINIHPSALPLWRGASPIQHTILNGEATTAITIMQMDKGMDSGPILSQNRYEVGSTETSAELHDRLSVAGANELLKTLCELQQGQIEAIPQQHDLATYTKKIRKSDALLNWNLSAEQLSYCVRAYNSWPVAFTHLFQERLRIWKAVPVNIEKGEQDEVRPGTIVGLSEMGMDVMTANGVLRILEVQCPGSKVMSLRDFVNGRSDGIAVGETVLS